MGQFNLPSGVRLRDLEPGASPDEVEFWDKVDRAYDRHVDRCLAEGKHWSPGQQLMAPRRACTYPARPVNGGSLKRALPKTGQWHYEPKYNGWRALVHAPTGTMFNRYGARLTIQREFSAALALLKGVRIASPTQVEWFDCEALERRHNFGKGTLMVFDYIVAGSSEAYEERRAKLSAAMPVHNCMEPPDADRIYAVPASAHSLEQAIEVYCALRQVNRQWRCPFYEGLVAKRSNSFYPVQLRSATLEFPGWVKHRWAR